jgi:DNA-3-methyladenine glycosylase II
MADSAHDDATTLALTPVEPFSFEQSLGFLRGFTPCSGDHHCSSGVFTTGGYADGDPFVATVTDTDAGQLAVGVEWLDRPGDLDAVGRWLRAFLSLDDDLGGMYETAEHDAAFARVVEALYGYHHVRFSTPFEAACWAALSQRTPMSVATRLKRALVEACGRVVERNGAEVALFPTPAMVLANDAAVRAAIDHDRKAKTVLGAAEAFATEDLSALADAPLEARLADVWGFGEWSSEFITLRGFGRLSGLPRTEDALREAVADLYELADDAATDADLTRLSAPYAPQAGYWAHYIRVWAFRQSLDE